MKILHQKLLPRSLSGRVFVLFALSMLVILVFGLGMFYRYQFLHRLANTQDTAETLAEVTARAVAPSAAKGDDGELARTPRHQPGPLADQIGDLP